MCGVSVVVLSTASPVWSQPFRLEQSAPRSATKIKPPAVTASPGPIIPGLRQGAVPQGLTFAPERNRLLISHYFENAPSCISALDVSTGKMTSCVTLEGPDGQRHRGHVGGVAVRNDSLFVASDGQVIRFRLADFASGDPQATARAVSAHRCATNASFCAAASDLLLVGEFAYGKVYPTDSSHHLKDRKGVRKYAWVCGYDSTAPPESPSFVLSVRQRVQGICVSRDRVYLSVSYGRTNRSLIVVYQNPIGKAPHRTVTLSGGATVPLWFLDGVNYVDEIDFPPMSEGIVMVGDRLAVLSESGAGKYLLGGKGPLDRVLLLNVSQFE